MRFKLPPRAPLFPNPVQTVWDHTPTPNTMYMPVYVGPKTFTLHNNFYLLHDSPVGTIVPIRKKCLPIKYWLLCDGTVMPKTNYEMLYYRIRGLFGDYDDEHFTLPQYEYDHEPEDEDTVWIIKYYKRIPGRGGQKDPNTNENYYYVIADSNDQNPGYLDEKLDKMFNVTNHKMGLTNNNDNDTKKHVLYYYGTYKGQLGFWPWPFQFDLKHVSKDKQEG